MGHKWMWNASLGGRRQKSSSLKLIRYSEGVREETERGICDIRSDSWIPARTGREKLSLREGIPIRLRLGCALGCDRAGCRTDDMVNVIGTSTCIIGITPSVQLVPGVCGDVEGSVHSLRTGIEAGLWAVGDIFHAIATPRGNDGEGAQRWIREISRGANRIVANDMGQRRSNRPCESQPAGDHAGMESAKHRAGRIYAAIEGTAFHTRVIFERMTEHGVEVKRVINAADYRRTKC